MTDSTSSEDELVALCNEAMLEHFEDQPPLTEENYPEQRRKLIEVILSIAQQEREKVWREIYESPHIGGMKWRIARVATEHGITLGDK